MMPSSRQFKSVIFDMDGTIVDNLQYHAMAWVKVLARHGFQQTDVHHVQRSLLCSGLDQFLRDVLVPQPSSGQITTICHEKERLYRELYRPHMKPLPGLVTLLMKLNSSPRRVGLATSASGENVALVLDGLRIRQYFDVFVSSADVLAQKPAPNVYLRSAGLLATTPQQCLVFEDSLPGIEAASSAGMTVIVLTTSLRPSDVGHYTVRAFIRDFTDSQLFRIMQPADENTP